MDHSVHRTRPTGPVAHQPNPADEHGDGRGHRPSPGPSECTRAVRPVCR
jgi:hypothetical protein